MKQFTSIHFDAGLLCMTQTTAPGCCQDGCQVANLSQNDIVGPVDQIHQSLLRHGHRTSGAVLGFLAPELWRQILLSPVGCKVGPPWIGRGSGEARSTSSALYHIFRAIPGQFEDRQGVPLLCGIVLDQRRCLGGQNVSTWHSQDPEFPSRTLFRNERITVIHFNFQWLIVAADGCIQV